jgi:hypothetical protein
LKVEHVSSGIPLIIRSSKLYLQLLVWSSWWWALCHSKHVEPSINFGVINFITSLHLVGYFYCFILRCTDPWILKVVNNIWTHWLHEPFPSYFVKYNTLRFRNRIVPCLQASFFLHTCYYTCMIIFSNWTKIKVKLVNTT